MRQDWLAGVLAASLVAGVVAFPPSRSRLTFGLHTASGGRRPPDRQRRDANSNLAFLGFIMALLDTAISITSMITNNDNNNNNNNNLHNVDVMSMNMNNNMVTGKTSTWSWVSELASPHLEGLWRWSQTVARLHPGCIARLVCETHRMSEHHTGVVYLLTTFLSSASSFLLAEAFQPQLGLAVLMEAARVGRQKTQLLSTPVPYLLDDIQTR